MQATKDKLLAPARAIVSGARPASEPPANGLLLHGKPGNGKTLFAEALAGELQVPIVSLTYGAVSSKWLGEMPRVISNCFAYAKANAPCLLFVDEIDSFLRSRQFASVSSEDLKITNTLLTEIVAVRDHRVVLVGATNYLDNLDAAAVREGRFDLKVEITPPDEAARIGILRAAARKYCAGLDVDPDARDYIARRWDGYPVSRITAVAKALPAYAGANGLRRIGAHEWIAALREVQGRSSQLPAGAKRLGDLVLDPAPTRALSLVARRLADAYRIESLGGTLPGGILLHGPSGSGRTTAARALALESGWALVETTGARLLADRDLLDRLHSDAAERRPAILFVDDADDVVAPRRLGPAPDLLARIGAFLGGGGHHLKDVLLIITATCIDNVEQDLLRAGRIDAQIELTAPGPGAVTRFVRDWLCDKQVRLSPGLESRHLAQSLGGHTFAEIDGMLQRALNDAIDRTPGTAAVVLAREDFSAARSPSSQRRTSSGRS